MNFKMKYLFLMLLFFSVVVVDAQPRRRGGGPEEMIKREQQNLYENLTDLSDDQKLLLDGIYDEYAVTFEEKMREAFRSRDRTKMRETMQALVQEKDSLIADVLNKKQYKIYEEVSLTGRRRREDSGDDQDNN